MHVVRARETVRARKRNSEREQEKERGADYIMREQESRDSDILIWPWHCTHAARCHLYWNNYGRLRLTLRPPAPPPPHTHTHTCSVTVQKTTLNLSNLTCGVGDESSEPYRNLELTLKTVYRSQKEQLGITQVLVWDDRLGKVINKASERKI